MMTTKELERLTILQNELAVCDPSAIMGIMGIEKLEELLALLIKQETSI